MTTFGQGDAQKWDKNFNSFLRLGCKKVRLSTFTDLTKEIVQRVDFIYKDSMETACITPWMQVLLIKYYMKSGDPDTTYDNSIAHLGMVFAYVKSKFPHIQTFMDAMQLYRVAIYADDHIFACPRTSEAFLSDFRERSEFYAKCGHILKESDDVVTTDVTQLTFLGARVLKRDHCYVPLYDEGRCWSSAIIENSTLQPFEYYQKIYSLLLLITYGKTFDELREYMIFLIGYFNREYVGWYPTAAAAHLLRIEIGINYKYKIPLIPTKEWCERYWTGHESLGLGNPSDVTFKFLKMSTRKLITATNKLHTVEGKAIKELEKRARARSQSPGRPKPRKERSKSAPPKTKKKVSFSKPRSRSRSSTSTSGRRPRRGIKPSQRRTGRKVVRQPFNKPATTVATQNTEKYSTTYDRWRLGVNGYAQTLLDPFNVVGIRVPSGTLPSSTFSIRQRWTINTRIPTSGTTHNCFMWIGLGVDTQGATPTFFTSKGNVCSLIPNRFSAISRDGATKVWDKVLGGWTPGANIEDVFEYQETYTQRVVLASWNESNDAVTPLFSSFRVVSGGMTITPLGNVLDAEGMMNVIYIPGATVQEDQQLVDIEAEELETYNFSVLSALNRNQGATMRYKPEDVVDLDFIQYADSTASPINPNTDGCAPGGWWVYIDSGSNAVSYEVEVALNYEAIARFNTLNIGVQAPVDDQDMINQAWEIVGSTSFFNIGTNQTTVSGSRPTSFSQNAPKFNSYNEPTVLRDQPYHHNLTDAKSSTPVRLQGPHPLVLQEGPKKSFWGGVKDFARNTGQTFLDKLATDWVPMAVKLAGGAVLAAL
jgi:hypothetical protein